MGSCESFLMGLDCCQQHWQFGAVKLPLKGSRLWLDSSSHKANRSRMAYKSGKSLGVGTFR